MQSRKYFLIISFFMLASVLQFGCNRPSSEIQVKVRNIHVLPDMGATGGGSGLEVMAEMGVFNKGSEDLIFDQMQASYYSGETLVCAETDFLMADGNLRAMYSQAPKKEPPQIDTTGKDASDFKIKPGHGFRFDLRSANAGFGEFPKRRVVVQLFKKGRAVSDAYEVDLNESQQ